MVLDSYYINDFFYFRKYGSVFTIICLGNRCLDKGLFGRGHAHLRKAYGERMKKSLLNESLKECCLNAWKQLCSKKKTATE